LRYDFDTRIERRGSNSTKWDQNATRFGRDDVLSMWVADMDFPCPDPVVRALKERTEHPVYGYSFPPASVYDAIIDWCKKRYGWQVEKEWIVFTAGVVNALYTIIEAFSRVGDEVILQSPVYPPFFNAIRNNGRHVLNNQLIQGEDGYYRIDWDDLETKLSTRRVPLLILCSPHNPVGRVWTEEELSRLANLCLAHDCLLISDEIHCDLLLWGKQHTATATLGHDIEQNTITLMAASKTFNLAGLATSYAVIPDEQLRQEFTRWRAGRNEGNMFGFASLEAAYSEGGAYLEQLTNYLEGNMEFFSESLREKLPQLKMTLPQATYLAWVDMRGLGLSPGELQRFMRQKARLGLNDGHAYGPGGEGFQRFNLGCARSIVVEAVSRLEAAIKQL